MNCERQLSQSLPDRVILSDLDDDGDDEDDDEGDNIDGNGNKVDNSDKHLRQDSFIRRYNDRLVKYDRFQGYRSSYKRAIENFDTTPCDSPIMGRSDLQYYRNSKTKDVTNKSDPVMSQKAQSDDAIIMDCSKWTLNDSDRDYEDIFPVHIERRPSGQHERNRRNPHFHGNRAIRPRRVIGKTGDWNIGVLNIPERSMRFFRDIVTTLIEEQWKYFLTIFSLMFMSCWLLFAILWFLIAYAHGDLNFDPETGARLGDGSQPCVEGCKGFAGYLLLSIETQVSIGFGNKLPTEECPEAIFLMIVQIITGLLLEGALVGIAYAKMVRPRKRSIEQKFSKRAVICLRDNKLCLVFRIDDLRQAHIIGTKVRAIWVEDKRSAEGEKLKEYQYLLTLENDGKAVIFWPQTISHVIDEKSPLFDYSAKNLMEKRFQIILTITGGSRTTGQVTQARTSYLPREVFWGHRFKNLLSYNYSTGNYEADYSLFDETNAIDTPLCSAKRLSEVADELHEFMNPDFDFNYMDLPEYDAQSYQTEDEVLDYSLTEKSPKTTEKLNHKQIEYINNFPVTYERRPSVEFVKRKRLSFRRKVLATRRAVKKTGDINIRVHNITRSVKYLKDFVTTLIDEQWRYTLTVFTLSYFVIWVVFGVLFYWVGYRHGDLDIDEFTGEKVDNSTLPCIMKCQTFIGFLLLSIETQTTIGFGSKYPSEECPETITLIVIQMIVSTAIEGAMIGIVYTKMIRPPKKTRDYTFSRKAVVCMRDSKLCLVFRIDDPKRNHTIETRVEAFWLGSKTTEEGEQIANYQYSLKLENDGMVSLLWPQTIAHVINEDSPLYDFSAKDFLDRKFEVIVSISGSSRSTGQVTQALASYLSKEIMWGHRFVNIISYDSEKQTYLADYNRFDSTEMIPTALCSACRLDEVIEEFKFQQYKENSFESENFDN